MASRVSHESGTRLGRKHQDYWGSIKKIHLSGSQPVIFKEITRIIFSNCPLPQTLFYKQSETLSFMLLLLPILGVTKFKPSWDQ